MKTSVLGIRLEPNMRDKFKEKAKENFMRESEYARYLIIKEIMKGDE